MRNLFASFHTIFGGLNFLDKLFSRPLSLLTCFRRWLICNLSCILNRRFYRYVLRRSWRWMMWARLPSSLDWNFIDIGKHSVSKRPLLYLNFLFFWRWLLLESHRTCLIYIRWLLLHWVKKWLSMIMLRIQCFCRLVFVNRFILCNRKKLLGFRQIILLLNAFLLIKLLEAFANITFFSHLEALWCKAFISYIVDQLS